MKSINIVLAFLIVAGMAAISPPAISFYYGDSGPMTVEFAAASELTDDMASN